MGGDDDVVKQAGIDLARDDLRQWLTPDELRELYIIEHGMPGTERPPLLEGEAEALGDRTSEIVATGVERKKNGEPRIWRWEDYPDEGPPLF